jgi:hypothetical protein
VLRNALIVTGALIQNVGGLLALAYLRRLRLDLTGIHAATVSNRKGASKSE